jgi:CHAD domain-containing protein
VRATTKTLSGIAGKQFRRLRRAGDALPEHPSDDELHRLRILGKRGRYAAELAEPIVGKPAARFVARAKAFQDVLGEHQDSVVLERRISEYGRAAVDTPVAFVAGRLAERQRARRSAARAAFPKAWKRLRKSGARAWS